MSKHYTATIEINTVETGEKIEDRQVMQFAKLVVRADTVEKLQAKVSAHVALIED